MKTRIILIAMVFLMVPFLTGANTPYYPRQLGNTPAAGDLLQCTDPTTPADWVARTTICCDLDEAYDAGNTIDFTGAVPVDLHAVTAHDPGEFLRVFFNTDLWAHWTTTGSLIFYDGSIVDKTFQLEAATGAVDFNMSNNMAGNLNWAGENTAYVRFDASADCVSIVPTEYIGDAIHAGNLYIADGTGNYPVSADGATGAVHSTTLDAGDTDTAGAIHLWDGSTDYYRILCPAIVAPCDITLWTGLPVSNSYVTINGTGQLAYAAIPAAESYGWKTIDCSTGTDPVADAVDDTLALTGGTNITVTGDSATDTATVACTLTDTDTDTEAYVWPGTTIVTLTTSYQQISNSIPVVATGTAIYLSIVISTWTLNGGSDTLTVALYVDGGITDTWTMTRTATGTGAYGAAVSEAITIPTTTVSHYLGVYAKRTDSGAADVVAVALPVLNVRIL